MKTAKTTALRRITGLILCALMILSCASLTLSLTVSAEADVSIQNGTGNREPHRVGESVGYRAIVNGTFTGFSFAMPTWEQKDSECTISFYVWDTDFATTVKASPVASKRFAPMRDNAVNWVTFDPQPAGEYLFLVSEPKGEVGIWTNEKPKNSKGFLYNDGLECLGEPELKIRFTESPETPFGQCESSTNGDAPTPVDLYSSTPNQAVADASDAMGVRVKVTEGFTGFKYKMATYYATDIDITYSVYAWKGSYEETIAEPAKAEGIVRLKDNAVQGINFAELPAGEYLFLVHDPTGSPAMYICSGLDDYPGVIYNHGYELENRKDGLPLLTVVFARESKKYFDEPSKSVEAVDGNHTPPAEYVIPEDSLIRTHEVMPDTWVFTDALGRVSLTNAEVGGPREDKTVALFYWTWHVGGSTNAIPFNNQKAFEEHPEAANDYNSPVWPTSNAVHFWNEPIYGYYRTTDEWVLRRQAQLLADAGIDGIFTDNTNGTETWRDSYLKLYETWDKAMQDGVKTPKVSFMLPFSGSADAGVQIRDLYLDIYRPGKYQNLWFYWEGKPMLMAWRTAIDSNKSNTDKEAANFFTYRANDPGYQVTKPEEKHWGWLSMYPQAVYYASYQDKRDKKAEQITVGTAMNHNYVLHMLSAMNGENIAGRSYTSEGYHTEENAILYGYNLAEQWNYALSVDPKVVFVTGWNEWKAGRYVTWPESGPAAVNNAFPDQCNDEYSRDCEPTKGKLKDNYYYELVNFIRQYKGVRAIPTPSGATAIDINAGDAQWADVGPYYAAYIGDTGDRDALGYGKVRYTEYSGRNDIIGAKVARDEDNVYFYVECNDDITPYTDKLWMVLYIDSDQTNQGWETFDYVINKTSPTATAAVLERFTGNGYETEKVADVSYKVNGKTMQICVPKSALGLTGFDFTVNFAWTDNVHDETDTEAGNPDYQYSVFSGDIMDFYISGDVAPGGRYKFSYVSTAENASASAGTDVETLPDTGADAEPDTEPATAAGDDATVADETVAGDVGTQPDGQPTDAGTGDAAETGTGESDGGCKSAVGAGSVIVLILTCAELITRKRGKKEKTQE